MNQKCCPSCGQAISDRVALLILAKEGLQARIELLEMQIKNCEALIANGVDPLAMTTEIEKHRRGISLISADVDELNANIRQLNQEV